MCFTFFNNIFCEFYLYFSEELILNKNHQKMFKNNLKILGAMIFAKNMKSHQSLFEILFPYSYPLLHFN